MPPPRDTRSEASVSTTAADDPPPRPRVLVAPPPAQTARPLRQARFASPEFPLELPDDLRAEGVITDHVLVASHSVVMDPAYVHITRKSMAEHARLTRVLNAHGVYAIGRYGGWTYCSIEDNMVEARALMTDFEL